MKRPIITDNRRRLMYSPELELAFLKLKRQLDKSSFGLFFKKAIDMLSKIIDRLIGH